MMAEVSPADGSTLIFERRGMGSAAAKHLSIWKMAWGALSDGGPASMPFCHYQRLQCALQLRPWPAPGRIEVFSYARRSVLAAARIFPISIEGLDGRPEPSVQAVNNPNRTGLDSGLLGSLRRCEQPHRRNRLAIQRKTLAWTAPASCGVCAGLGLRTQPETAWCAAKSWLDRFERCL